MALPRAAAPTVLAVATSPTVIAVAASPTVAAASIPVVTIMTLTVV